MLPLRVTVRITVGQPRGAPIRITAAVGVSTVGISTDTRRTRLNSLNALTVVSRLANRATLLEAGNRIASRCNRLGKNLGKYRLR